MHQSLFILHKIIFIFECVAAWHARDRTNLYTSDFGRNSENNCQNQMKCRAQGDLLGIFSGV